MNTQPLVSVICLCYNQKEYVGEAIRSVQAQTYANLELIIVDDASTDGSPEEIEQLISGLDIPFIRLTENRGNCAAFNEGFRRSKGEFVIDLAADDLLLPIRIAAGVADFEKAPQAGVHFSDAFLIASDGAVTGTHYSRNPEGHLIHIPPIGNVYEALISRYFICPPTMMIRRQVLEELKGYDETLLYEDFDFWIRSSRKYEYLFNKAPLVKRRVVPHSHSSRQFAFRNPYQQTTFRVCEKIFDLNQSHREDELLIQRIHYEIRQCVKTLNFQMIPHYLRLRQKTQRRLSSPSRIER